MTEEYKGKWIVYRGGSSIPSYLQRLLVEYVFYETKKQVKCTGNKDRKGQKIWERTVPKSSILAIVDEKDVSKIRNHMAEVQNNYYTEQKKLFKRYETLMALSYL